MQFDLFMLTCYREARHHAVGLAPATAAPSSPAELPVRFEDPAAPRLALDKARQRPRAAGVAAFADGRLAGYLIGDIVLDAIWGRSGWVRLAGCALAPGQSRTGEGLVPDTSRNGWPMVASAMWLSCPLPSRRWLTPGLPSASASNRCTPWPRLTP